MKEKYEMAVMNSFLKKEISLELKDILMEESSNSAAIIEGSGAYEFLETTIEYLEREPSTLMELYKKIEDDNAI